MARIPVVFKTGYQVVFRGRLDQGVVYEISTIIVLRFDSIVTDVCDHGSGNRLTFIFGQLGIAKQMVVLFLALQSCRSFGAADD